MMSSTSTINTTNFSATQQSISTPDVTTSQPSNLYDMLGGEPTIKAAVDSVSQRIVHDTVLRFFVSRHELEAGKEYVVQFFTSALMYRIPSDISLVDEAIVDQLRRLFNLGFNETHFDQILEHLVLTFLESFGVNRAMVIEVARNGMPLRRAFENGAKEARSRQSGSRFSLSM
jgi:truncated hemoglobin YjbI